MGRLQLGAEAKVTALPQRARQPRRVARKLDGGGVGEKLALAAYRGLDEPAKEDADPANHQQRQPEQGEGILVFAAAAAGIKENPANDREADRKSTRLNSSH